MSEEEIAQKVAAISEIDFAHGTQLDALTISMIEMDEYKFDRIISTNIQQLGFEQTMLQVIYPFLDKLSVLWLTGSINPVQESFMSCLIRQKIIAAINSEPFELGKDVEKFLIYLPEGETQELSLLFMHYLLKKRKKQVYYLGLNISVNDLVDACQIHEPDFIFTMVTETYTKRPVQKYVDELSLTFPNSKILISGYQIAAQNVRSVNNIRVLQSLDDTIELLDGKS